MMEKKELRPGRPVVESTVSGAVEKILIDAADAGVTLDDIKEEPKIRGEFKESQENLDKLVELKSKIEYLEVTVDFVKRCMDNITWRHQTIRNTIEWRKFMAGQ